ARDSAGSNKDDRQCGLPAGDAARGQRISEQLNKNMANPREETGTALRPSARLIRTLGEELISNEVVAVIELVKNAYDADATNVLIRFTGPLERDNGGIEVIDNGHGMELKTVETVWMEPATPSKRGKK